MEIQITKEMQNLFALVSTSQEILQNIGDLTDILDATDTLPSALMIVGRGAYVKHVLPSDLFTPSSSSKELSKGITGHVENIPVFTDAYVEDRGAPYLDSDIIATVSGTTVSLYSVKIDWVTYRRRV